MLLLGVPSCKAALLLSQLLRARLCLELRSQHGLLCALQGPGGRIPPGCRPLLLSILLVVAVLVVRLLVALRLELGSLLGWEDACGAGRGGRRLSSGRGGGDSRLPANRGSQAGVTQPLLGGVAKPSRRGAGGEVTKGAEILTPVRADLLAGPHILLVLPAGNHIPAMQAGTVPTP